MFFEGGNGQSALAQGGEHDLWRQDRVRRVEAEAFETGAGEDQSVRLPCAHLVNARIDVASDLYHTKIRTAMQELCATPEAGGGNNATLWQPIYVVALVRDEDIRRVVAFGNRREDDPFWKLCRYVFCGVHRKVYLTAQERLIELAREDVTLVYDGEW